VTAKKKTVILTILKVTAKLAQQERLYESLIGKSGPLEKFGFWYFNDNRSWFVCEKCNLWKYDEVLWEMGICRDCGGVPDTDTEEEEEDTADSNSDTEWVWGYTGF